MKLTPEQERLSRNFGLTDEDFRVSARAFVNPDAWAIVYEDHGPGYRQRFFGPGYPCLIGAPVPRGTVLDDGRGRRFLVAAQGCFLAKNFTPKAHEAWKRLVLKATTPWPKRLLRRLSCRWGGAATLYVPLDGGVATVVGYEPPWELCRLGTATW